MVKQDEAKQMSDEENVLREVVQAKDKNFTWKYIF